MRRAVDDPVDGGFVGRDGISALGLLQFGFDLDLARRVAPERRQGPARLFERDRAAPLSEGDDDLLFALEREAVVFG